MKWFNLFLIFGVLAMISSLGTLTAAEPQPNPEPKGRPHTTRRPRQDNGDNVKRR
ncbi:uncharacterized protein Dwil_GK20811 [Drosophila willistoni]|uniref:Uncharacterized protein n=1 Tax=Drosophila willistoni TaxID=7260 RepID=B4MJH0_DROWI|nr:uncharacterized protein LOC6638306 [Drosophila willistoni]EDW72259.1 uncharacterized protein Dwil_GK20811 [Drosophila willistoni]